LSVVYATIAFSWNDPDLQYPPDIRKQAVQHPITYPLSCRVQIGCRWILVDTTWDRPLGKAGFPVNDPWDGYSETRCAVKPLKSFVRTAFCYTPKYDPCHINGESELSPIDCEKDHLDSEGQERYYRDKVAVRTPEEVERITRYNRYFDSWLIDVRQRKYDFYPDGSK